MYIKRVELQELKGFKLLDFRFYKKRDSDSYAGWNVITGENASGKTAFLKALAMSIVGPDVLRALQPSLDGWIRKGKRRSEIAVEIVSDNDVDRFAKGKPYQLPFWSELVLSSASDQPDIAAGNARRKGKKGPINGPWHEKTAGWFAAGYGPFRRLYGASPDAQRVMSGPQRVARFSTMFREDATLGECEIWLKDLSHKALEKRKKAEQTLEQVLSLLGDDFLRNGMTIARVNSDGLWLSDAKNRTFPLRDMSEGYRAALAMMLDLCRHMSDAFEGCDLVEKTKEGRIIVPHAGVVLIDEIDAHLHPTWQQKIGFWLRDKFPNVQFIVTTHSPMVCQAASEMGIYSLPSPASDEQPIRLSKEDYFRIVRGKPDEILRSDAFRMERTRSELAVINRRRYAELQAKKRRFHLSNAELNEERQLRLFSDEG